MVCFQHFWSYYSSMVGFDATKLLFRTVYNVYSEFAVKFCIAERGEGVECLWWVLCGHIWSRLVFGHVRVLSRTSTGLKLGHPSFTAHCGMIFLCGFVFSKYSVLPWCLPPFGDLSNNFKGASVHVLKYSESALSWWTCLDTPTDDMILIANFTKVYR